MRDFSISSLEHDLLAAEARTAERIAIRRRVLDDERRQSRRLGHWLQGMAVRFGLAG